MGYNSFEAANMVYCINNPWTKKDLHDRLWMVHKNSKKHSIRSKIQFSYGVFLQINQKEEEKVMILKDVKVYQFKVHVLEKDIEKEIKLNALL